MVRKEITIKKRKIGYKRWWDKECSKCKREVKEKYRKWKKGKGTREEYIQKDKGGREYVKRRKELEKKIKEYKK